MEDQFTADNQRSELLPNYRPLIFEKGPKKTTTTQKRNKYSTTNPRNRHGDLFEGGGFGLLGGRLTWSGQKAILEDQQLDPPPMAGGGPLAMNLLVVSQDDVLQKCRNHRIEGLATHHPSQHFIAWETGRLDGRASEQPPGWGCSNHQSEVSVVPVQPLGCRPTFENLSPESCPCPIPPRGILLINFKQTTRSAKH